MKRHRVVITGTGVVSAIGHDTRSFWESLSAGRHGFADIESVDTASLQFHAGAEVRELDLESPFSRERAGLLDRFARLWLVAVREAVSTSGLEAAELASAGVFTGTSMGGQSTQDDVFRELYRDGRRRLSPLTVPRIMASAGASAASMELGIKGPGLTVSTACASSSHAIGLAMWAIERGATPVAVAGGSEAPFSLAHLKAWDALRSVSPELCRPFSRGRNGLLLGEGAGALVLESLDHAKARGATIQCELAGFGMSSDAAHITKPSSAGAARAITMALDDAECAPEAIDYVNAHGTGTLLNDAAEAAALREVFGPRVAELPVSSTKSMHGHTLGAAGAIECVASALALEHGIVPPTANYLGPAPDCPLDVVPNAARSQAIDSVLSPSLAFGGLNAALVLKRWHGG